MHADHLSRLWIDYRAREIDTTLHPDDHMFNTAVNGLADYEGVGVSAMQVISNSMLSGPSYDVRRVLDFGCGHGRVARHLRAFFPDAELFFTDIDETGSRFCASQFNGQMITASDDFSAISLPNDLDIMWAGSVFTHLDFARTLALFDALVGSLRQRGTLVATFRGEHMYHHMSAQTDPNQQEKWRSLLQQYERSGFGYTPYDFKKPEWGLSLSSIQRVADLGQRHPDLRLVTYSEAAWAAAHDVAAWARKPD